MKENIHTITRRARVNVTRSMERLKKAKYENEQIMAALHLKADKQHLDRCEQTRRAQATN